MYEFYDEDVDRESGLRYIAGPVVSSWHGLAYPGVHGKYLIRRLGRLSALRA